MAKMTDLTYSVARVNAKKATTRTEKTRDPEQLIKYHRVAQTQHNIAAGIGAKEGKDKAAKMHKKMAKNHGDIQLQLLIKHKPPGFTYNVKESVLVSFKEFLEYIEE
jgi:hypothetical protein